MQIEIQARDFALTEALATYIERRMSFALSSRYDQIKRINVQLKDINGPRGGVDKLCQIRLTLPRLKDIVIEDTQSDLYVAIDRAADRAGRTLNRRLARHFLRMRKIFIPHNQTTTQVLINGVKS